MQYSFQQIILSTQIKQSADNDLFTNYRVEGRSKRISLICIYDENEQQFTIKGQMHILVKVKSNINAARRKSAALGIGQTGMLCLYSFSLGSQCTVQE